MKRIMTCSVVLAGYVFGGALMLCGLVLYAPYAVIVGGIKLTYNRLASKKVKALAPSMRAPLP